MWHANGNANGNCHIHSDGDCHGNAYAITDSNGHGHIHSDGDCHGNAYANSDSNSNDDCDRTAAAYTDATATADTAASPLAFFGIRRTRENELASSQPPVDRLLLKALPN